MNNRLIQRLVTTDAGWALPRPAYPRRHHFRGPWCAKAVRLVRRLRAGRHGTVDGLDRSESGLPDGTAGRKRRVLWRASRCSSACWCARPARYWPSPCWLRSSACITATACSRAKRLNSPCAAGGSGVADGQWCRTRLARRGAGTAGRWQGRSRHFLIYSKTRLGQANLPRSTEPDHATHA